jgi:hypothetical protein
MESLSTNMIRNIYFRKFESRLWLAYYSGEGHLCELNTKILRIQKRVIKSMVGVSSEHLADSSLKN